MVLAAAAADVNAGGSESGRVMMMMMSDFSIDEDDADGARREVIDSF